MTRSHRARPVVDLVGGCAVAAALLLACCGTASASSSHSKPPTVMDWGRLPVTGFWARTSFHAATAVVATSQAAIRSRITTCMAGGGDRYESAAQPAAERAVLLSSIARAPSVAAARRRGLDMSAVYRSPSSAASTPPTDPAFAAYLTAMSPARHDLFEHEVNSCTAAAIRPLQAPPGSPLAIIEGSYRAQVLDTPTVSSAHAAWMACMAADGHPVHGVVDLEHELQPRVVAVVRSEDPTTRSGRPTTAAVNTLWKAERSAAVDQARCDVAAYAPVLSRWLTLERRWVRRHRTAVAHLDDQVRLSWPTIVGL